MNALFRFSFIVLLTLVTAFTCTKTDKFVLRQDVQVSNHVTDDVLEMILSRLPETLEVVPSPCSAQHCRGFQLRRSDQDYSWPAYVAIIRESTGDTILTIWSGRPSDNQELKQQIETTLKNAGYNVSLVNK